MKVITFVKIIVLEKALYCSKILEYVIVRIDTFQLQASWATVYTFKVQRCDLETKTSNQHSNDLHSIPDNGKPNTMFTKIAPRTIPIIRLLHPIRTLQWSTLIQHQGSQWI